MPTAKPKQQGQMPDSLPERVGDSVALVDPFATALSEKIQDAQRHNSDQPGGP
jgi:hypothetical protein